MMAVVDQQDVKMKPAKWLLLFIISFMPISHVFGLIVPRFVCIRSRLVNMHVGPGTDYPIVWQYNKIGYPLEVIAEFGLWRQVRDVDGTLGWMHKNLLSSKRMGLIRVATDLHKEPKKSSETIAYLSPNLVIRLLNCLGDWCHIEIHDRKRNYKGWIKKKSVWGLYLREEKLG